MKLQIVLLIAVSFGFYSCQQDDSASSAIISGVLSPSPGKMIYILPQENCVGYRDYAGIIDSIPLDSQGNFKYHLASIGDEEKALNIVTKEGYHILNYPLFVKNGDSFFCEIQKGKSDYKYQVLGNGMYCQEYQIVEKLNKVISKANWARIDYSIDEDSFLLEMQQRQTLTLQVIDHFFDSLGANESEFKKLVLEDKLLNFSSDFYRYLNYHNYYANDTFLYKLDYSSRFTEFLEKVNGIDPVIPFTANHIGLVENQLLFEFAKNKLDTLPYEKQPEAKWSLIENNFNGNKQIAAIFYFLQNFTHTMANEDAFDLLDLAKNLASKTLSESQKEIFNKKYKDLSSLKPGAAAPDFTLPNKDGEMVSLSHFKGKVIYLDFWGTWCMPCLQEIENNHSILDSFESRDDFVMISIALEYGTEEIAKWKRFVSGENIYPNFEFLNDLDLKRGNHLVAEKQFNNKEIAAYKVNFAPTYVLIDKDFKIAKPRANRPKNAFASISELLINNGAYKTQ